MSIFNAGRALLNKAYSFSGCVITYRRGENTLAVDIPAKEGKTVFRYIDYSGITARTEQYDFIVREKDLKVFPETGDEIICGGDTYLVSAPNDEPCWRWHSRGIASEIRIHTKKSENHE